MTDPGASRTSGLRALFARESGALYVHVHAESGVEHRTLVLSPGRVRVLRWAVSRWGIITAIVLGASWVYFAVQAARLPAALTRVAAEPMLRLLPPSPRCFAAAFVTSSRPSTLVLKSRV